MLASWEMANPDPASLAGMLNSELRDSGWPSRLQAQFVEGGGGGIDGDPDLLLPAHLRLQHERAIVTIRP
jgi:hypothetical protein